jgi:hypothetical protein
LDEPQEEIFDDQRILSARIAVACGFFAFGLGFAVWAVHIRVLR